ncbi:uncharacterized protein LOC118463389 isoform X2 [Anopheles albimanus]|nr:uncharacterized protein LOC118463389 isoform X2 [Anopheles albimanus]
MQLKSYLQELQEAVMPLDARHFKLYWERRDAHLRHQISTVFCADPPDTRIRCKQHESHPAIRAHQKLLAIYCSSMAADCWQQANEKHHGSPIWWLNVPLAEYSDCVAICCLLYLGEAWVPVDSFKRIINTMYIMGMHDEISKIKWSAFPVVAALERDPVAATNSDPAHGKSQRCNISSSISSSSSSSSSSDDEVEGDTTLRPASKRPRIEGRSKDFHLDEAVLRMFHLVAQKNVKMAELVEALESSYSTVYGHYRELFGKVNYNRPTVNDAMLAKALMVMNEVDSQNPTPHSRVSRIERARRILAAMRDAVNREQQQHQQQQQNAQMRVGPDGDLAVSSSSSSSNSSREGKYQLEAAPRIDGYVSAGLTGTNIRPAGPADCASVLPAHRADTLHDVEAVSMEHHRNTLLVALAQSVMAAAATFNHRICLPKEHTQEEGNEFPAAFPIGALIGNGSVEHWQAFRSLPNARLMPS